jgi:hypothetical protein
LKTVVEAEAEALGRVQRRQTHYPEGVEAVETTAKILLEVEDGASTREDDGEAHQRVQRRQTRSIPEGGKNIRTTAEVGESISNQPGEQILHMEEPICGRHTQIDLKHRSDLGWQRKNTSRQGRERAKKELIE